MSLALGALALLLIALLCFLTLQRLGVSSWTAQAAVFFSMFGTGLFHYGTYDSCFSHVYSALLLAVLLWVFLGRAPHAPGWGARVGVAVLALLLILVRNTNVFLVALGAVTAWSTRARAYLLPLAIGAAGGAALQLAYNTLATGGMTVSSYGAERFIWDRPMWDSVLFSYERGLFTYYPIFAVALAAGLIVRRTRTAALALGAFVILLAVFYGFWWSWYLGGGFGHRGFVEIAPAVALLLGVVLESVSPRARTALLAACLVTTSVTVQLMWGYWWKSIPFVHPDARLYWAHVWGPFGLPVHFWAGFTVVALALAAYAGRRLASSPKHEQVRT